MSNRIRTGSMVMFWSATGDGRRVNAQVKMQDMIYGETADQCAQRDLRRLQDVADAIARAGDATWAYQTSTRYNKASRASFITWTCRSEEGFTQLVEVLQKTAMQAEMAST